MREPGGSRTRRGGRCSAEGSPATPQAGTAGLPLTVAGGAEGRPDECGASGASRRRVSNSFVSLSPATLRFETAAVVAAAAAAAVLTGEENEADEEGTT